MKLKEEENILKSEMSETEGGKNAGNSAGNENVQSQEGKYIERKIFKLSEYS